MYNGDQARKTVLVEHGFRLPSALDNRPLRFEEFEAIDPAGPLFVSATPGPYELEQDRRRRRRAGHPPHRPARPRHRGQARTGARSPTCSSSARNASKRGERVLVTALTKRLCEDLTNYLDKKGCACATCTARSRRSTASDPHRPAGRVRCARRRQPAARRPRPAGGVARLHPRRRQGRASCARPQSLIQQMGRAARNVNSKVIMYADTMTPAMQAAIEETERRRAKQTRVQQASTASRRRRSSRPSAAASRPNSRPYIMGMIAPGAAESAESQMREGREESWGSESALAHRCRRA
jgi:excinuclease ABC subunit B